MKLTFKTKVTELSLHGDRPVATIRIPDTRFANMTSVADTLHLPADELYLGAEVEVTITDEHSSSPDNG